MFKTEIHKGFRGWVAETKHNIGELTLNLSTMKRHGGEIVSHVNAVKVIECKNEYGDNYFIEQYLPFDDFSKQLQRVKYARTTEKNVMVVHNLALAMMPDVINEAIEFYKGKAA